MKELNEQVSQTEQVVCLVGTQGKAFDAPNTKRAYTYADQLLNVEASMLGTACQAASAARAGDSIDRGLQLLKELQDKGFGVFDLGAEYAQPQPAPLLTLTTLERDRIATSCQTTQQVIAATISAMQAKSRTVPDVVQKVMAEVFKATTKFPTWPTDPLHALAVLGEEFGELTQAVLQSTYEPHKSNPDDVKTEAIQTAAMALRFLMSLDRYQYTHGEQHLQGGES